MSDLGDIKQLVDSEDSLSDLDWLEVDEEEYHEFSRLPKQNLDSIPELEAQWNHIQSEDGIRLSPINQDHLTPFWSEKPTTAITDSKAVEIVEKFLKRNLQAGATAKESVDLLQKNFDKNTLSVASTSINAILKEQGLIGTVYVDSSLYPLCFKGDGQSEVVKNNKKAKFVLAKTSCRDCVYAQGSKCAMFQKELVFDVDYDQDLWEDYRETFIALDKDIASLDKSKLSYKKRIQTASLAESRYRYEETIKPIVQDVTAKVSHRDAINALSASEIKREVIANAKLETKVGKVAKRMLAGNHPQVLVEKLESDPDLYSLKKHANLLGNLYLDLSFFRTDKEAKAFIDKSGADHTILVGFPSNQQKSSLTKKEKLSFKDTDILNAVLHRYALSQYGKNYEPHLPTLWKVASKLVSSSESDIRAFAQATYATPLQDKVKAYESLAPVIFDPTRGVTTEKAVKSLKAQVQEREVVADRYQPKINHKLSLKMMVTEDHSSLKKRIASEGLKDDHLYLLGHLYKDSSLFENSAQEKEYHARNQRLANLPEYQASEDFFKSPEIQNRILERYAQVQNLEEDRRGYQVLSGILTSLDKMSGSGVQKFAKFVFASPLPKKVRTYETFVDVVDKSQGQSFENAMVALSRAKKMLSSNPVTSTQADKNRVASVAKNLMERKDVQKVRVLIASETLLKPLEGLENVLGSLYVDKNYFKGDVDFRTFIASNPHLEGLPHREVGEKTSTFYKRPDVVAQIAERAAVLGGHPRGSLDWEASKIQSMETINALGSSAIRKLAFSLYSKPLPRGKAATYEGNGFAHIPRTEVQVKSKHVDSMIRYASEKVNEGEYGDTVRYLIKSQFSSKVIEAGLDRLKKVLAAEGLMGVYYVDPSIYDDCDKGAKIHRQRGIKLLKKMSACDGCVFNIEGNCHKYNKVLLDDPLEGVDKDDLQARTLSSEPDYTDTASLMAPSGLTIMEEMGITTSSVISPLDDIEMDSPSVEEIADILFTGWSE